MKNILVPTDFSIQAEKALKVAAELARKFDGEIFLLHMLELPLQLIDPIGSGSRNIPEAIFFMKLAHQRFAKIMKEPYLKGIKVHETVEFHRAFDGIMEISRGKNCDLIVMGSHGASGFQEMFIGSNTEKVVRHSEIPVLVIKMKYLGLISKILFWQQMLIPAISMFSKKPFAFLKQSMQISIYCL